jgi:hypothetical protein
MLLIPATIIFTSYARNTNDEVLSNQLNLIGNTVLNKAEEMYVLGSGSWVTIDANIPDAVEYVYIANGDELVFVYDTVNGRSNAVFFSQRFKLNNGTTGGCVVNCTLPWSSGANQIRIELKGLDIQLKKVN